MSILKDSLEALNDLTISELQKESESQDHGDLQISSRVTILANGITRCTVTGICKVGCEFRVEAFGEEAIALRDHAEIVRYILQDSNGKVSQQESKSRRLFAVAATTK